MMLYLAGPMTGKPFYNFPEFFFAAAKLRHCGFGVFNPAELDMAEDGFNPFSHNPAQFIRKLRTTDEYLQRDFAHLAHCDGVALLDDWQNSYGAKLEVAEAHRLNIPTAHWTCWANGSGPMLSINE